MGVHKYGENPKHCFVYESQNRDSEGVGGGGVGVSDRNKER